MNLSSYTLALLEDIERRIDPEIEEEYFAQWVNFWDGKCDTKVFVPSRKKVSPPQIELKNIHINDALQDMDLMLAYELTALSKKLASHSPALGIRANYGTGIMTSLFGAPLFEMPRSMNTLPTTKCLESSEAVARQMEKGIPNLRCGLGGKVLDFGSLCAETFVKYPKIQKYVSVYHPDAQGTLDIAELLWGQEMFYEMYDNPDFVHQVLRCITDSYKAFMDAWYDIIPKRGDYAVHWSIWHKGTILLRLDSAMNLSRDFYEEFSKPYDTELLNYYDGGCMHFCGRGDHYIDSMCEIDRLYGFNMSQPHLNNMAKILDVAERTNIRILDLPDAVKYSTEFNVKKGLLHAGLQ